MMNLFPEYITLNGNRISVDKLIATRQESSVGRLLGEWYSTENFIEVQTSGSTGTPKTIRLDKHFVGASVQRTLRFFDLKAGHRILHCLPEKYIAGKVMILRALLGNLNLYTAPPDTGFSFLHDEAFRFAAMVPAQVSKILNAEPYRGAWLNKIDCLLIGGSAIPPDIEALLHGVSTSCYSSYAATETATHIALRKINGTDASDFYTCLDDIRVKLSDDGCLQIFMPGLSEQPLQTTDLAWLINEKTFRILGRSDNVIISGGIKYYPEQLETKLARFIKVPFLISSLPHHSLGEQLVLVVEGNMDDELLTEIKNICTHRLSKYEQPKQIVVIRQFPLNKNYKTDRNELRNVILRNFGQ